MNFPSHLQKAGEEFIPSHISAAVKKDEKWTIRQKREQYGIYKKIDLTKSMDNIILLDLFENVIINNIKYHIDEEENKVDKKILVIEDDLDMHRIYRVMLEEEDFDITYVTTGEEGLKIVKEGGVYLVLLDMILKESTWDSFLLKLRMDPVGQDIPVIVVSVLRQDMLRSLLKLGNVRILEKPISRRQLLDEIQEVVID